MARKKGNTGKRYTDEQKKQIMDFVKGQGRGGISEATRKWGVSYIALKRWMGGGSKSGRKPGRPAKVKDGLDGRTQRKVKTALKTLKGIAKQVSALQKALKGLAR